MKLLSHGTKFTPITEGNYFDAKRCTEEFTEKLKKKFVYHNSDYTDNSLVRKTSTRQTNCTDEEMKQIIRTIDILEPDKSSNKDNLTPEEREALQDLRNDQRIIIKEADKCGALVIMNREFYENKLILADHLYDQNTYKKVKDNADRTTASKLKELIKKHDKCSTKKEIEYTTNYDWVTSEFYIRPKVHKCKTILEEIIREPRQVLHLINGAPDLVGRPIIAGTNSPTRQLSDLISKILSPLVELQTTYIKDDLDFLRKLPRTLKHKCKLFGCDIKSLYTSIPHVLGLRAIGYWIIKHRDLIPARFTNAFILESVEFLLTNNNCSFKEMLFNQINGTAMGASFASFYTCLTIGFLEETKLIPKVKNQFNETASKTIIDSYKRFMDDGIVFLPWQLHKTCSCRS